MSPMTTLRDRGRPGAAVGGKCVCRLAGSGEVNSADSRVGNRISWVTGRRARILARRRGLTWSGGQRGRGEDLRAKQTGWEAPRDVGMHGARQQAADPAGEQARKIRERHEAPGCVGGGAELCCAGKGAKR